MKGFIFMVFTPVPGTTCHFVPVKVYKSALSFEEALEQLTQTHPGHCIAKHLAGLWREEGQEKCGVEQLAEL